MLLTRLICRSVFVSAGYGLLSLSLWGQALFDKPVKVLGDPNFIGTASNPLLSDSAGPNVVEGRELQTPEGIALDTTGSVSSPYVYIADTANNRVLAFKYSTQLAKGAFADIILGQPNRFTTVPGGSSGLPTSLHFPTGLAVDSSGNLYVADTGNNRIVRYPQPFAQPATVAGALEFPDLIIGQTSFSAGSANSGGVKATTLGLDPGTFLGRTGLAFDSAGNLWVTDTGNNRVLRFPASALKAGQNDPAADTVIGQAGFTTNTAATSGMSLTTLLHPTGVAFDASGNMFVSDGLSRVLVFPPNSTTNAAAVRLMGVDTTITQEQPTAISIGGPASINVSSAGIAVADAAFNRVLLFPQFSSWPAQSAQFSPSATEVLGQSSFITGTANAGNPVSSASSLSSPVDIAASASELFVVDTNNNRVLVFPIGPGNVTSTASRVIGQLDFQYNAPNLVVGAEFDTVISAVLSGAAVLDTNANPPHLYVADTGNNRILGFNNFYTAMEGQTADLVIGQPNLFQTYVNYPSGLAAQPGAQGLNSPSGLAIDSAGNLFVADTLNSRVVRFPAPFASGMTNGESADLVIGQSGFSAQITTPTGLTMVTPVGLAFTQQGVNATSMSGWLAVSDVNANRVLLFPRPFTSGMSATIVLGQTSFTGATAGNSTQQLNSPAGVAADLKDRILVADTGNGRVQVFPAVQQLLASGSAASFSLTANLQSPAGIGMESTGTFWVADVGQNGLLHFPTVDNLPVSNPPYSPDASVPAITPHSAVPDQYGNLVVADGINRLLYFAPQVNAVNAANSLAGRALAAGTITSLYPAVAADVLAPTTQPFTAVPLTGTLANTQVLVNGTPSPLLYVSPGQINLVLSNSLPGGGTANLEVVNSSTGQVYGATEVQLASASPGLFVQGSLQSGPAAALNQDNSVNTASNPIARGQTIQLFGTGQGYVPNAPPDGQQATGVIATPILPQVTIGSGSSIVAVPAANVASALAPGYVGLWQVNVTIPMNAPTGSVPIILYMNSIPSNNPAAPTQIVTTISIK